MKQFFKIGEISKLYNIGQDSLRYYEEIGILNPMRAENNYRQYQIEEIWRLNVIRELRELGFSMERIGSYLKYRNVKTTKEILHEEIDAICEQRNKLKVLEENVHERLKNIDECYNHSFEKVEEVVLDIRKCHSISSRYKTDEEMDVLIKQLMNYNPEKLYIIGSNSLGSIISLDGALQGRCRDYTHVFVVDKDGEDCIESGKYLTIRYKGMTEENYKYLPILLKYAKDHNYKIISDIYEILWIDIHASKETEEHVNELQIRVEKS